MRSIAAAISKSIGILSCAAALLLPACTGPDGSGTGATVTDSAGVTIVDLPSIEAADTTVLSLSTEPLLSIGVETGDPVREFHRIAIARFLGDDAIAVASRGSADIRLFDMTGAWVRTIGRAGSGPGEFASPNWMQTFGNDTIAVLDPELRRATVFDRAGAVLSTAIFDGADGYPWPRDFRMPGGGYAMFFDANDLFDRINAGEVNVGETARVDMWMLRLDETGSVTDSIGRFAGAEYAVVSNDGRVGLTNPVFGRLVTHAFGADGFWIGTQEAFDIAHYTYDGRLARRVRDLSMDLSLNDGDLLEFAALLAERQDADAARRAAIERQVFDTPRPATRAAHGEIRIAPDGTVWVAEAVAPFDTPSAWTVIHPRTGDVARVLMPEGFRLADVGDGRVVGILTDQLGVERVVVHALVR